MVFGRSFKGVSRDFQRHFKGFKGCIKKVSWVSLGSFKGVSKMCKGFF